MNPLDFIPNTRLTLVDVGVTFAYFLLMVAVGLICRRLSSNISDYIRAGCKGTWWLVGVSIFMGQFSALTFTGIGGQAYIAGSSALMIFWGSALACFIQAIFFAPLLRQTRVVTSADAIRARFGPVTEQVFCWISPMIGLIWGSVVVLGLATFLGAFFGVPVPVIIVSVGVVVLFYSVLAGAWGALTSDFLQFLILVPTTIAVAVLALIHVGGVDGLFTGITNLGLAEDFQLVKPAGHVYQTELKMSPALFTTSWVLATLIGSLMTATNLAQTSRYLTVKTGREASKAAALAGVLLLLGSLLWIIPPMVGRLMFSGEIEAVSGVKNAADAAYAIVSINLLPVGMIGLVIVTMLAATMSTLDGMLTHGAGMLINNAFPAIRRKLHWKEPSIRANLLLTKGVNLCLNVILVSLALAMHAASGERGLYHIMINVAVLVGTPLGLPFAFALLIKRVPAWSALFTTAVGFSVSGALLIGESFAGWTVPWDRKTFLIVGIGATVFFTTRLFWKTSPEQYYEQVREFFKKINTPVDFEMEVGKGNDHMQLKINGTFGLVIGTAILNLLFFVNDFGGIMVILGVVLFIWLVSLWLLFTAMRMRSKEALSPRT